MGIRRAHSSYPFAYSIENLLASFCNSFGNSHHNKFMIDLHNRKEEWDNSLGMRE